MKQRLVAVLIFAFLIALGASFVVYKLVEGKLTALAAPVAGKVLVAAKDLPIGTLIRESDLAL
ncbi:MAG TPA: hypothetical protein VG672_06160, partial [Bryobacteraceae bacterium]|nr:hypothetical protein [Bryobacteraceae bacterium]